MSRVVIEPGSPADAPRIAHICRDEIELGLGWRWRAGAVARMMSRPDTEVAVARAPGGLTAGFGILELGPEDAELVLLAVDPRVRRRGIGRDLLGFLEAEARVAGIGAVWLHVRARNATAIAFYERAGYVVREQLRGHYGGREDGLRMQHRLVGDGPDAPDVPDLGALLRGPP
jgi:ribosomal-protein-alanine N-acetyltransferase